MMERWNRRPRSRTTHPGARSRGRRRVSTGRLLSGIALLATVLLLVPPAAAADDAWWQARWNRRCALTLTGTGAPVADLPVIVQGRALKALIGDETLSAASLRVIGPAGEVPSQLDEFDGTGRPVAAPNHELDDDDELVFQADLPAAGRVKYWLYWSTVPLPPGRYPSALMAGDPVEPLSRLHDIQLWNRRCMVGLRGPARGDDPTRNESVNWGAGTVVLLDMDSRPVIGGGWTTRLPGGAIASHPCAEAARWEKPRVLMHGPVRAVAVTRLDDVALPGKDAEGARADVEHRVWLYERGACLCFEETIRLRAPLKKFVQRYEQSFGFGADDADPVRYSTNGVLTSFAPSLEQKAAAKDSRVVFQAAGFDPWMAAYSAGMRSGHLMLLAAPATNVAMSCYSFGHRQVTTRFDLTWSGAQPGEAAVRRFWVAGLRDLTDERLFTAVWRAFTTIRPELGAVEAAPAGRAAR